MHGFCLFPGVPGERRPPAGLCGRFLVGPVGPFSPSVRLRGLLWRLPVGPLPPVGSGPVDTLLPTVGSARGIWSPEPGVSRCMAPTGVSMLYHINLIQEEDHPHK